MLLTQRCLNHGTREAVARCPECAQFYCRECITEHEDRVICSACLKKTAKRPDAKKWRLALLVRPAAVLLGVLVALLFFYCVGRVLVAMPASFHEGTVWETTDWTTGENSSP